MKAFKIVILLALTNSVFAMTGDEPASFNQAKLGQDLFGEHCAANGDSFSRVDKPSVKTLDTAIIAEKLPETNSGI